MQGELVLHTVIGRLAHAVRTLEAVRGARSGRLDALDRTPEYVGAVAAGYPEVTEADLRAALAADHERHRVYAEAYTARKRERQHGR